MLSGIFASYGVWDYITTVLDIGIVAFVIYKLLFMSRGTRAVQLVKGIIVLLVAAVVSNVLELTTIKWLLSQIWAVFFVMLVITFILIYTLPRTGYLCSGTMHLSHRIFFPRGQLLPGTQPSAGD